jgi:hypothetical protein
MNSNRFLLCSGLVVITMSLVSLGSHVFAACTDGECSEGCKTHDRWCSLVFGGFTTYKRFGADVANTGYCVETPDGGNDEEYDLVSWDQYPTCTMDCQNASDSTGSPGGEISINGSNDYKTICSQGG